MPKSTPVNTEMEIYTFLWTNQQIIDPCTVSHYGGDMTRSTDKLLADIERFLVENHMSATAFGEAVMNHRHLVRRLRSGCSVTLDTADRIRAFMSEVKPRRAASKGNGGHRAAA